MILTRLPRLLSFMPRLLGCICIFQDWLPAITIILQYTTKLVSVSATILPSNGWWHLSRYCVLAILSSAIWVRLWVTFYSVAFWVVRRPSVIFLAYRLIFAILPLRLPTLFMGFLIFMPTRANFQKSVLFWSVYLGWWSSVWLTCWWVFHSP